MGFPIKIGIFALLLTVETIGRSVHQIDENSLNGVDATFPNDCNCEKRYNKHYETKGCEIEDVDTCGCPTKYTCPSATNTTEQNVCVYENEKYKIGSRLKVTDVCQVCRCIGRQTPYISCRQIECPQLDPVDGDNCFLIYAKDRCCPTRYECVTETVDEGNQEGSTCVHENITYPYGAKIYSSEDPCLVCECDENWNGIENASCLHQNCMIEKNKHRLDAGCIPVYHEARCCPIEFYCPEHTEMSSTIIENDDILDVEDDGMQCIFAGEPYEYGTELIVENSCIRCRCSVPPDFTCIHQSCPLPPSNTNCITHYRDNECCPRYECFFGDETDITEISFTPRENIMTILLESMDVAKRSAPAQRSGNLLFEDNVSGGNEENIFTTNANDFMDSNSTNEIECPTPICADETCVIIIPDGHICPTCVCQESFTREKNPLEEISNTEEFENENGTHILQEGGSKNLSSPSDHEFLGVVKEKPNNKEEERMAPMVQEGDSVDGTSEDMSKDSHEDLEGTDSSNNTIIVNSESKQSVPRGPRRKRSRNTYVVSSQTPVIQQQWNIFQDDQEEEELQSSMQRVDSSEIEREMNNESGEDFDELKLFPKRVETTESSEMSLESVIWISEVPGCPTPLCDNSTCRIGILPGHHCPTCICERRSIRQP